jgi:HEAT repeat protein
MYPSLIVLLLTLGLTLAAGPAARAQGNRLHDPPGNDPPGQDGNLADEMRLQAAGLSTDGAGLLAFFRQRTRGEATPQRLAALVERLGAKAPAQRQQAAADLVAIGPPAIPLLRQAVKDPDLPEAAARARACLQALEKDSPGISAAAARLLARRRPAGAAEALLAYLPAAEDETVLEEVRTALVSLAYDRGQPDPALLRALEDPVPLRRASAIMALCHSGTAEPRAALRKLLQDPTPSVRLRASLALAHARDAKAVSTLIALLADLPPEQGREALDFLSELAAEQSPKEALGDDELSRQKCRDAWATWWLASEGPGLLSELRKRTLTEDHRVKALRLIEQLGDDDFQVREKAKGELKGMGASVVSLLRQAVRNPDLEVRQRAQECLKAIEMDTATPLSPVTPRLVALRKPAGAAEALLAFLPFAEDPGLVEEVQSALNAVTYRGAKADPAVVKALQDKVAVRRAAAAEALCQGPAADHLPALHRLLKDPEAGVRLKVALALAGAQEREAVPVLIALVGELPAEQAAPAEEYLRRLAARRPPEGLPEGGDGEARKKRQEAWAAWWAAHGARVRLVDPRGPEAAERYHGYTLLVQNQNNTVTELGADGKVRWKLTGLVQPWDAQVLPGGRVLVAEYSARRVTERNLKGEVLWQTAVPSYPMSAERLPNGHTFIACRHLLLEVDRTGREVRSINRPLNDVRSARMLRDGQIVLLTSRSECVRLDRTGKELKSFALNALAQGGISTFFNEILPNGHVLLPVSWMNKVVEYNADGKVVWETTAAQPMTASRLPNGNTLIVPQQWPARVVEVDRQGRQVAELPTTAFPARVRRR